MNEGFPLVHLTNLGEGLRKAKGIYDWIDRTLTGLETAMVKSLESGGQRGIP